MATKTKTAFDYSTINQGELEKLPVYSGPHKIDSNYGSACFLDAPGYPSYFVQQIYNSRGDNPSHGATMALSGRVVEVADWPMGETWDTYLQKRNELYKRLYNPLPVDHPRVKAWARMLFGYFRGCYVDMSLPEKTRRNVDQLRMVKSNELPSIQADPERFVHRALQDVRLVYPDYESNGLDTGGYGGPDGVGDWWERYAERFTAEECPGFLSYPHRVTGWCQMCGCNSTIPYSETK